MELIKPQTDSDSAVTPIERIGFDVIRAIVSARAASSPTVQALAKHAAWTHGTAPGAGVSTIDLFNGRGGADGAAAIGAFRPAKHAVGEYR